MSIETLSVDVLLCIFRALRDSHVAARSNGWIAMTHVCQEWRLAALETADLWTHIYSLNVDCVRAFILRSKQAPLDIRYLHTPSLANARRIEDLMDLLLAQSHRLRHVDLQHFEAARHFYTHPLAQGAPLIKTLHLELISLAAYPNLRPGICRQGLPNLHSLSISLCPVAIPIAIQCLVPPSIRSLTMQAPTSQLSVSEWISILVGLPLLENLCLSQVFLPGRSEAMQRSASSAYLPYLADLSIIGDTFAAQSSLLQRIRPADNVRIAFTCGGTSEDVELPAMMQLLDALGDKFIHSRYKTAFTHPSSIHLSTTYKDHRENMMVTLSAPSQEFLDTCDCQPNNAKPILDIGFHELPVHPNVHSKLCRAICEMISRTFLLVEMRTFRLSSQYNPLENSNATVPEGCKELFSQMPNISDLSLSSEYIHTDLLLALQTSTGQGLDGSTGTTLSIPFPSLRYLTLHQRSQMEHLNLDLVHRLLLSRQELGLPISHVRVHRDAADYNELDALRASFLPLAAVCSSVDFCKAEWQGLAFKREIIRVF